MIKKPRGDESVDQFGEVKEANSILIFLQYKVHFEIQIPTLACDNIGPWQNSHLGLWSLEKSTVVLLSQQYLVEVCDFLS